MSISFASYIICGVLLPYTLASPYLFSCNIGSESIPLEIQICIIYMTLGLTSPTIQEQNAASSFPCVLGGSLTHEDANFLLTLGYETLAPVFQHYITYVVMKFVFILKQVSWKH